MLTYIPAVELVTSTVTVQLAPAPTVPALRVMVLPAGVAVRVPPQVVEAPFGVATVTPVGRLSVKASPVTAIGLAVLSMVSVSVVVAPSAMGLGAKLFVKTGTECAVSTVLLSVALLLPGW